MQTVKVWLALADRVIQLRFERDVVVEVVARAKRRAMAQKYVFKDAARIRIRVLAPEKWTNLLEALGKLGIERRHVEHGLAVLLHVADQEAFVEELYPMSYVYNVRIHDGLAKPGSRREIVVGYLVVVERAAEL